MRYKDAEGNLQSDLLKKKKVEVICPLFYTDENINTAMLRRLISEELTQQDSKIYYVRNIERSYAIAKEVFRERLLRPVREFVDDTGTIREAWFYGVTQEGRRRTVIKVSANHTKNILEIFVAAPGKLLLTGCLAEIGWEVSARLERDGLITGALMDMAKKEEVLRETISLIEKYSEAELEAGDTEQWGKDSEGTECPGEGE
ncbi:MAG: hypothetical protein QXD84_06435 [Thermoplasmata archaeon]